MKEYSQILPLPPCTPRCRRYDSRMDTSSLIVPSPSAVTDRNIRVATRAELAQLLREKGEIKFNLSPLTGLRQVVIPDSEESRIIAKRLRDL